MPELDQGTCRSCGAPIYWVRAAKTGKAIPLNPEPQRTVVTARGEVVVGYETHFATCPQAAQHRRAR